MDQIIIKDYRLFAFHGVNPEEKQDGQHFVIDAVLYTDLSVPCRTDNVTHTTSYAQVMKTIRRVMTQQNFNLLERAADAVIQAIFAEYPAIAAIDLTLKKPEAPMKMDFGWVGVALSRSR